MQVERGAFVAIRKYPSGERVSNALVTYPKVWNNSPKGLLIPHTVQGVRELEPKLARALQEGPAAHQVVGGVKAHQAIDG